MSETWRGKTKSGARRSGWKNCFWRDWTAAGRSRRWRVSPGRNVPRACRAAGRRGRSASRKRVIPTRGSAFHALRVKLTRGMIEGAVEYLEPTEGHGEMENDILPIEKVEKLSEAGRAIYNEKLRPLLEPEHNGQEVAIHLDTGDYEVGAREQQPALALRQRHPDGRMIMCTLVGPPRPDDMLVYRMMLIEGP
jgi:hypothetical protein